MDSEERFFIVYNVDRKSNILGRVFEEYRFSKEKQRSFEDSEPTTWARPDDDKVALIKAMRA